VALKKNYFRGTAILCLLAVILGIGGSIIFSSPALGDNNGQNPSAPDQSPGEDTTGITDSLQEESNGVQAENDPDLLENIALSLIGLY
jgi:hypothetical protein